MHIKYIRTLSKLKKNEIDDLVENIGETPDDQPGGEYI
jgi:hypothetical protein